MELIAQILWAVLPGIITGAVLAAWNKHQKERDDEADRREAERQKDEKVKLDLLVATAELTRANAVALKDGRTNGEMKEGLRRYNIAIENFRSFEREKLSENA